MKISRNLPSNEKLIPVFSRGLMQEFKKLAFNKDQIHDIKLSLEEALANAIKHGNKFDLGLNVEVSAEADDNSLAIIVADQGQGFDFKRIPDPTKPDNLGKLSGRGILLIKNHMDAAEFLEGGRKIKMVKLFKRGQN